ncbi:hypothetical protein RvY_10122 [Ramazzottius varieornatus]|uniref:Uncharacterized protein n=1 Tax=Ramazzottius varieornatus TaxID=947166 RepID=A0A1D1VBR1_RAMVA|nr:hypothetical protein RvY_10122 [Ramazzottius varieornatus]
MPSTSYFKMRKRRTKVADQGEPRCVGISRVVNGSRRLTVRVRTAMILSGKPRVILYAGSRYVTISATSWGDPCSHRLLITPADFTAVELVLRYRKDASLNAGAATPSVSNSISTMLPSANWPMRFSSHCSVRSWYLSAARRTSLAFSVTSLSEQLQYMYFTKTSRTEEATSSIVHRPVWLSDKFDSKTAEKTGERAINMALCTSSSVPSEETKVKSRPTGDSCSRRKLSWKEVESNIEHSTSARTFRLSLSSMRSRKYAILMNVSDGSSTHGLL